MVILLILGTTTAMLLFFRDSIVMLLILGTTMVMLLTLGTTISCSTVANFMTLYSLVVTLFEKVISIQARFLYIFVKSACVVFCIYFT